MNLLSRFAGGLAERVLAVVLAVGLAQFPLYFQAYRNTVAGAQTEAALRYQELVTEAARLQLSVEGFVEKHEDDRDAVFQASGRMHRTTLEHYQRYGTMVQALDGAPAWRRPVVLAQNFDRELYAATRFSPGLPLTFEGGAYALIGLLLAWMLGGLAGLLLGSGARPRYTRVA